MGYTEADLEKKLLEMYPEITRWKKSRKPLTLISSALYHIFLSFEVMARS